jgi:hypothetical protein
MSSVEYHECAGCGKDFDIDELHGCRTCQASYCFEDCLDEQIDNYGQEDVDGVSFPSGCDKCNPSTVRREQLKRWCLAISEAFVDLTESKRMDDESTKTIGKALAILSQYEQQERTRLDVEEEVANEKRKREEEKETTEEEDDDDEGQEPDPKKQKTEDG